MKTVFNPNVPNVAGVYYQSYGANCDTLGAQALELLYLAMLPIEGTNDGLVSVSSANWSNYRGTLKGWFGVNHLSVVGLLELPILGYDPPTHFVNMAADLKNRGY